MKIHNFANILLYASCSPVVCAFGPIKRAPRHSEIQQDRPLTNLQNPLGGPSNMMSDSARASQEKDEISMKLTISDVIGKIRNAGIFCGLTGDIDSVSGRLDDSKMNATVLAPTNEAMKNLPRKPWENPEDYNNFGTNAYSGQSGEERANKNMRRFVESHIVPESPWVENHKVKTLAGNEVWYEIKDGEKIIQPGEIKVVSIADKVSNGEIWVLSKVINPKA